MITDLERERERERERGPGGSGTVKLTGFGGFGFLALALAAAAFVAYFAEERILKRADENCFGPFYIIYVHLFALPLLNYCPFV